ncbi:MAG TPA: peptidoglycan-binding protein [Ktedonobacteraceae bacterium]
MKTEGKKSTNYSPLRRAREMRNWSQEELARQVSQLAANMGHPGVVLDVSTISRWERGLNTPSPFYRHFLCSLFAMNAEELGLLSTDSAPQPPAEQPPLRLGAFPLQNTFSGDTLSQNTFSGNMPGEQIGPPTEMYNAPTEAYSAGILDPTRYTGEYQAAKNREQYSSSPDTFSSFLERRRFLLMLLAGGAAGAVIVGGGAVLAIGLLQNSEPQQTARPPQPTRPPQPSPAARSSRHWPTVGLDIHKKLASVRVIQWMLLAHQIDVGGVDGVFGPQTANAVIAFQRNNGLPVTGTVSDATWEKLILPSSMTSSQVTDQGSQVKALQEALNTYGVTSPPLRVDGDFGPLTTTATRRFQQTHGLTVTGEADLNTWCLLVGGHLTH